MSVGAGVAARPARGRFDGALSVLRYNRPQFVCAAVAVLVLVAMPGEVARLAAAAVCWFAVATLVVAWIVYDLSGIYGFEWLGRIPELRGGRLLSCHAGHDDTSDRVRPRLPAASWRVLDQFDPVAMPGASIRRARRLAPMPEHAERAPIDRWPVRDGSQDGVFAVFAMHELRREGDRVAWLREARRVLTESGRVVLVEHVRDVPNLIAFGPGAFHFHSERTWRRGFAAAGLSCARMFRLTPFVRVFVLSR